MADRNLTNPEKCDIKPTALMSAQAGAGRNALPACGAMPCGFGKPRGRAAWIQAAWGAAGNRSRRVCAAEAG